MTNSLILFSILKILSLSQVHCYISFILLSSLTVLRVSDLGVYILFSNIFKNSNGIINMLAPRSQSPVAISSSMLTFSLMTGTNFCFLYRSPLSFSSSLPCYQLSLYKYFSVDFFYHEILLGVVGAEVSFTLLDRTHGYSS